MATHRHTQDIPYTAVPPPTPPPITKLNLICILSMTAVVFPSIVLLKLVGLISDSDSISGFVASTLTGNVVESQYRLQFTLEASVQRRRRAALAAAASLVATLLFPTLRFSSFLGSPLYNWSLLAAVVFCARYPLDSAVTASIAALEARRWQYKRWSYYANALTKQLGSAAHSALILLAWRFLQLSNVVYPVTRYGTWVFGAWMTRCSLILLNSAGMARWRAALFDRYEERILRVGFQFHIMYALIPSTGKDFSFMAPWRKSEREAETVPAASDWRAVEVCYKVEDHIRYVSRHKTAKQEVAVVAMHIQALTTVLPPDLGCDLAESVRQEQGISLDNATQIDKNSLKEWFKLGDEDARVLYGDLSALLVSPDDQVSFDTFITWMIGAYNDNLALGQTLREEDNAIISSDRLLMTLLVNKAFLLWLFLTGKTTTQVLTVIPFVYFAKCFIQEMNKPLFRMLITG